MVVLFVMDCFSIGNVEMLRWANMDSCIGC